MFRGFLLIFIALVLMIATVVGVVGAGLRRIAAANKKADAEWVRPAPLPPLNPTTNPTTDAETAGDEQAPARTFDAVDLEAPDAALHGNVRLMDPRGRGGSGGRGDPSLDGRAVFRQRMSGRAISTYLTGFHGTDDYAEWPVEITKAGEYEIDLTYGCGKWQENAHFTIRISGKEFPLITEATRGETSFRVVPIGKVTLPEGQTTLIVRSTPVPEKSRSEMSLRGVQLILAPQPDASR